jgi:hypothetical protein
LIVKNNSVSGYNKGGKNRIIIVILPINITLIQNRFIDATWESDVYGFALGSGTAYLSCPIQTYNTIIFSNNTFLNTLGRNTSHIYLFISLPQN